MTDSKGGPRGKFSLMENENIGTNIFVDKTKGVCEHFLVINYYALKQPTSCKDVDFII